MVFPLETMIYEKRRLHPPIDRESRNGVYFTDVKGPAGPLSYARIIRFRFWGWSGTPLSAERISTPSGR